MAEVCFWCGAEKENGVPGAQGVVGYAPCEQCMSSMKLGVTVFSATPNKNDRTEVAWNGVYPTGDFLVITEDDAIKAFSRYGYKNGDDKLILNKNLFEQFKKIVTDRTE